VTSILDDTSSSTFLTGLMWTAAVEECPQAEYTGIALEFGTVPLLEVLQALRADNWLFARQQAGAPRPPAAMLTAIGQQMLQAFFVDTDDWKSGVIEQARDALIRAIDNL
jgi:hypothetical protein